MKIALPTILVVDDETSVIESFKLFLEDKYNLLTATSGEEALEKIEKENINLVLLDILMPGMSGLEVLSKIKEKHVTTILGYTQLCLMDIDEKTFYYSDLKKVEEEAKRLSRMIKNLLNYSRPSELTTEPVKLNALIDTSLELLHHRIKHKNVEIIKE